MKTFLTFSKLIQAILKLAYDVAETSDFQRVCESISGMKLDKFFDAWIYGENYPKYTYTWGFSE